MLGLYFSLFLFATLGIGLVSALGLTINKAKIDDEVDGFYFIKVLIASCFLFGSIFAIAAFIQKTF